MRRFNPFYQRGGDKERGVGGVWKERKAETSRKREQTRRGSSSASARHLFSKQLPSSRWSSGTAQRGGRTEECVFRGETSLAVQICNLIHVWCAVSECYLYVGQYVCDEECVAELGNRSGLPNTHRTRTLSSGK